MEEGIHGFLVGTEIAAIAELESGEEDVPHIGTEILTAQANDFCFSGNKERNHPFRFPLHEGDTAEAKSAADCHGIVHAPTASCVKAGPCILRCRSSHGGKHGGWN